MAMRKQSGPTIKDIALRAGTNRTSVSVVLNGGRSSAGVSEATRQRIVKAADELSYTANAVARSLSQRRTNTISFYTGDYSFNTDVPFVSMIFAGLQKGCAEFNKDLLLHGMFLQNSKESATVTYGELANGKIDGVVLLSVPNEPLMSRVRDSFLNAVAMVDAIPGIPSVIADDTDGSRQLAEHLASRGHRRVLYRVAPGGPALSSHRNRWHGFSAAAADCGMEVIQCVPSRHEEPLTDQEKAYLLHPNTKDRPTAIVCFADLAAFPILDDCERLGIRVPDDLAVVGFDGIHLLFMGKPHQQLTTIRAHWDRVGWKAVELLSRQLDGEEVPEMTVLPVELIVGDTT